MSEFSDDVTNVIRDVAKNNDFANFEIQLRGATEKGDNYLGVVKFISIQEKDNSKVLDLVLKTAHTSTSLRSQMPLRAAYLREISMYRTILPQLLSFQKEHNIQDPFEGVPRIFGHLDKEGNESLLLEDLKSSDYKMWDRKLPMNREHVEIVLQTYGKFHAISFALKHLHPELFEKLTQNLKDVFEQMDHGDNGEEKFKKIISMYFKSGYTALGDNSAKEKLKQAENGYSNFFFDVLKNYEGDRIVLHGDCWCNNLMFQYKDITNINKPTKICLLDWQLSKFGAPALDLAYFLFVCTDKSILSDLDTYLNIYHESLSKNIRNFGCDPEKIFPYAVFKRQWQTLGKFGLWCAFSLVPNMLIESKDNISLAEVADDGKELWDEFSKEKTGKSADSINKRLYDVIISMVDNKLI